MFRVARLEWSLLVRGWTAALGVSVIAVMGLLAIVHGREIVDRQAAVIANSPALQAEEHRAILDPQPADALAGDQLYYLFFHTVREPSPWAAVAIGQRDAQPFNLKVRILALQGQLYDAELGSPLLAALGNFDLTFVFIVLVPLLIVGLTFNIWSAERELGTWDLVRSQPVRAWRILAIKFALRALLVWSVTLLLHGAAALLLRIPIDMTWLTIAWWLTLYIAFWIGVAALVTAARHGSDTNIVILLGVWLVTVVLGPALIAVAAAVRVPLPEALELTVAQRQGYHAAWDEPQGEVMAAFYRSYPEWQSVPIPTDRYSNGWYYAMQQRGDDLARDAAQRYRQALIDRDRWAGRLSWFFPPALLQRRLSHAAGTDLAGYLRYLDSVSVYHEALKAHFFPIVFSDATVREVDWTRAPRHHHRD
jgi:ABC-2 type transport system permease protein